MNPYVNTADAVSGTRNLLMSMGAYYIYFYDFTRLLSAGYFM